MLLNTTVKELLNESIGKEIKLRVSTDTEDPPELLSLVFLGFNVIRKENTGNKQENTEYLLRYNLEGETNQLQFTLDLEGINTEEEYIDYDNALILIHKIYSLIREKYKSGQPKHTPIFEMFHDLAKEVEPKRGVFSRRMESRIQYQ